jgi:hypothetical protein
VNAGPLSIARFGKEKHLKQRKTDARPNVISLRVAVYGFVALSAILAAMAAFAFVREQKAAYQSAALDLAVRVRLRGIELDLARNLDRDWRQLRALAERIGADPTADQRALIDFMVADGDQISWIGRADVDGTVVTGSEGVLEGENVAGAPWFRRGLEGNHAGLTDARELLEGLPGTVAGSSAQYINFATPLVTSDGAITGALGLLVDMGAFTHHLTESAKALNLDVFVVAQDGAIIVTTEGSIRGKINLASIRSAATGIEDAQIEMWPDGKVYATSVIPQVAYGDLPAMGWRLVGRIDPAEFSQADSGLLWGALRLSAVLLLIIVILSIAFVQVFILPFRLLAENADRIANGHDDYPYEGQQTAEIALLSSALVRLKGRD